MEKGEISRSVLLKLIEAILKEEELEEIAKIISTDPNLTAKILTFVNSAYYNLRREIHSVKDAIAYIGYKKLKEIAFALLLSATLKDKSKEELLKSVQLAYLTKALSKRVFPKLNIEDDAFLVGILNQVYRERGEELVLALKKIGLSRNVIEGIKNNSSPLGKVKLLAQKLLPWCEKVIDGDKSFKFPEDNIKVNIIISSCLESQKETGILTKFLK